MEDERTFVMFAQINDLDYIKYLDGVRKEFKLTSSNYILDIEEWENKEFTLYVWDRKGNDSRYAKSIIQKTGSKLVEKLEFLKDRQCDAHWVIPKDLYNYFLNKGEITKAGLRSLIERYLESEIRENLNLKSFATYDMIWIDEMFYYKNYNEFKNDYLCMNLQYTSENKIKRIIDFLKTNYNIEYIKTEKEKSWFKINDIDMVYTLIKLKNG